MWNSREKIKSAIPREQNYAAWLVKNGKTVFSKLTRKILSVSGEQASRQASARPGINQSINQSINQNKYISLPYTKNTWIVITMFSMNLTINYHINLKSCYMYTCTTLPSTIWSLCCRILDTFHPLSRYFSEIYCTFCFGQMFNGFWTSNFDFYWSLALQFSCITVRLSEGSFLFAVASN